MMIPIEKPRDEAGHHGPGQEGRDPSHPQQAEHDKTAPVARASAAAYGGAAAVPSAEPPACGVMTAATTEHTVPLGPVTNGLAVPKTGYAASAANAV